MEQSERQTAVRVWAAGHLANRDFVVVDTETSCLGDEAEILQLTVVNAWGRVAFSSFIQPECPIDEAGKAFEIHGIGNAMLAQAPRFQHVHKFLQGWFRPPRVVIAYNAGFDGKMLRQVCQRHRFTIVPAAEQWECAMLRYAEFVGEPGRYGGFKWHRLQEACGALGIADHNWHDASADALAVYRIMEKLAEGVAE